MSTLVTHAADPLLDALRGARSTVNLASPYISARVAYKLAEIATSSKAEWHILTKLDAAAVAAGALSVPGLLRLLESGVTLVHAERLHAKVFLADESFGLVGSANLTDRGLGIATLPNLELSTILHGEQLEAARELLATWFDMSDPVTAGDLHDLDERARSLARQPFVLASLPEHPGSSDDALAQLLMDAPHRALWLKAQYGMPHYDNWRERFWFSSAKNRRPSFKPGDFVLIYSRDAQECYAIVEVVDESRLDREFIVAQGRPEDEAHRWPWVNETVPRLIPSDGRVVKLADLGITGQSLQGGHKRLTIAEFSEAARKLAHPEDLG